MVRDELLSLLLLEATVSARVGLGVRRGIGGRWPR